jgi:putative transposase
MALGKPARLDRIFQTYDPPLFFITFCTARRRTVLANDRVHRALIAYGRIALDQNIALGRYVIMPDHIHLFVQGDPKFDLGRWIGGLKRVVAATIAGGRGGLWQRGFFDHLIRNSESYSHKWEYVRDNPLRAGLVNLREDWVFQGEIVEIDHA